MLLRLTSGRPPVKLRHCGEERLRGPLIQSQTACPFDVVHLLGSLAAAALREAQELPARCIRSVERLNGFTVRRQRRRRDTRSHGITVTSSRRAMQPMDRADGQVGCESKGALYTYSSITRELPNVRS
jgi:hypothetical protein